MLAAVLRSVVPSISSDPVLQDLIRSFKVEAPPRPVRPPAWDISMVLRCFNTPLFELLHLCSLRNLTKKVLFLVALATAKHVGELQAVSRMVSFVGSDACLSYVPEFVAKPSLFLIPFLALSWWSLCSILLQAWRMTCYFVLSEPSIFTFAGQTLFLLFRIACSSLLAFPRVLYRRMPSPFYERWFMTLAPVGRRSDL